ncbi:retrovirus-related pol polyprotein from transposon TNT 1-94 [Tanacetum coccineum]
MTMSRMQLNSKFVNNMLPEWGRFVTAVKLNRGLRDSNYDQLYAYLKQHEAHANENKMMLDRFTQHTIDPLALMSNVSQQHHYSQSSSTLPSTHLQPHFADNTQLDSGLSPTDNLIESLTNTFALLTQSYKTYLPQTNNQLRTSSNTRNQATIQDDRAKLHGTTLSPSSTHNSELLQDKMVLMQAQEEVEDLALNVNNVFQADDCDAFDSDVDEVPIASRQCSWQILLSNFPVYDEAGRILMKQFTEMHAAYNVVQARCLELEGELSKLLDKLKYQNLKESFGNNTSPPARDAPDFDSVFITQLTKKVNVLQEQNELLRAENEKVKKHYKELYDSIKITRAKHIKQITALLTDNENLKAQIHENLKCITMDSVKPRVLATGRYAIDVEPIPPHNRNNREVHLDYLKHLKESVETLREIIEEAKELLEYVIGTCPKDFNQRDKNHAATPLTRKKQVTLEDQCETSNSNTHKHVEQLNIQKTNVHVPPSIGVNSCTDASGSQPRSNTKKNRILPAKSVNKKKVEKHLRTNKCSLKTTNHVDSSISSKYTIINSNSRSVCNTCNKCFISENHDMCVVNYLNYVYASPSVKNVVRKVQQVWKPKEVKLVWKPTGKILTNVGYQWMPTGRTFTLGEQCPLTRLTKSKVVPAKQTENVSTSKTVITRKLSHTFQKPLTRYQRKNQPYQAVPGSIPTPPENKAIAYANQLDPNQNWGSNFPNSPSSSVFKCRNFVKKFIGTVRFGNDHFGAIMGYGDYVIGDSVISRVYYVEGLGHNLFFVGQFCDSDLEVAFRKHSCYVRDTDGVELIKGSRGSNLYTISVEDMMKSSPICLLSKASKNKSWLWHRRLNHLNFGTINDLARKDLVRGLPRLKFEKDHLCSACQLGKSKKHTHTPKTEIPT